MVDRVVVGRVDLVRVVAATVELPDFFVGEVLDHLLQLGAGAEEVLAHKGTVFGLVVLVSPMSSGYYILERIKKVL